MDVNWYTAEIMVQETLHAQRAKAEVARLAAIARQYRTRRGVVARHRVHVHARDDPHRVSCGVRLRRVGD